MMVANVPVASLSFISFNRKKFSRKKDYTVSVNMAYGEVTLKSMAGEVDGGVYENPDKMLSTGQYTGASPYETIHTSKSEAPDSEYVTVERWNPLIIDFEHVYVVICAKQHNFDSTLL